LEDNLEKIESKPGEAEAVVERQETPNEKVETNSPRAFIRAYHNVTQNKIVQFRWNSTNMHF
jgi:hypothetical protein